MDDEDLPRCKIVLLGDGRVGKTCLLYSYANGLDYLARRENYNQTLLENYEFVLPISGVGSGPPAVRLSSWDTAGQEAYDELRRMCYTTVDASVCDVSVFILCFAWDDPQSLTNAQMRWYREIRRIEREANSAAGQSGLGRARRPFRLLLCGTKYDLRTAADPNGPTVGMATREGAYAVLQSLQADAFVVCSAKTGFGVRDVFQTAIQLWLQEQPEFAEPPALSSYSHSASQGEENGCNHEADSAPRPADFAGPCCMV